MPSNCLCIGRSEDETQARFEALEQWRLKGAPVGRWYRQFGTGAATGQELRKILMAGALATGYLIEKSTPRRDASLDIGQTSAHSPVQLYLEAGIGVAGLSFCSSLFASYPGAIGSEQVIEFLGILKRQIGQATADRLGLPPPPAPTASRKVSAWLEALKATSPSYTCRHMTLN